MEHFVGEKFGDEATICDPLSWMQSRPEDVAMREIIVKPVDFTVARDRDAFVDLLDMYAQDPMGGAQGLSEQVKTRLPTDLAAWPGGVHLLAWHDGPSKQAVGLLNAFMGYSTFKARPLINVHDIAVLPSWRGQGVGRALLDALQAVALERGCCKLTLEVLSGNISARRAYEKFGFEDYALDPENGSACFMQKWL